MSLERIRLLVERFRAAVDSGTPSAAPSTCALPADLSVELMESMLLARHLDRAAHELRAAGHGHYTICSSGHEANVVLGRLTGPSDPSLIHYRSAALQIERARGVRGVDAVRDIALSLVASSAEPTSGGRHKVFGHPALGIIPQTSTIASHLPRAVGLAFALERSARLGLRAPSDSIALVSFGDASINHSTALGAFNAASWVAHQNLKLPVLFVCEDNGLGISVRTPPGWVAERARQLPHVGYFAAPGWDIEATYTAAKAAVEHCRSRRQPVFLHLSCVRLLGHAGSDVDTTYRTVDELEQAFTLDPVLCFAQTLRAAGVLSTAALLDLDAQAAARVDLEAERAKAAPRLRDRSEVMRGLARAEAPASQPSGAEPPLPRESEATLLTLAQGINRALSDVLEQHAGALVFGEDVARKGGVYGITKGLHERFGSLRVFNTLLDEQTILGLALGAATLGLLPIAEIQYLAYLHNAEDQLRGEAATMHFFSNGAFENPMLVRIAGLPYQKGFGGHFHNDNSLAVLRDVPGLVVIVPVRGDDALELYRKAIDLVVRCGRTVVVVEPIALYHRKDLAANDGCWLARANGAVAEYARARVYEPDNGDLLIITYGNGVALSLAAARALQRSHGIAARTLDLRWLAPLPEADIVAHTLATQTVLVVDECRRSGNVSEAIAALLLDAGFKGRFARVTSADCFIPLGEAAEHVLVSEEAIVSAAVTLLGR